MAAMRGGRRPGAESGGTVQSKDLSRASLRAGAARLADGARARRRPD